ncbi:MAG: hypothetical protein LBB51_02460 [Zoogloeaceae bacterium]|jgi:hypothetical protein|nr:hypothetical protein [Zoogloeaceae bacterium]
MTETKTCGVTNMSDITLRYRISSKLQRNAESFVLQNNKAKIYIFLAYATGWLGFATLFNDVLRHQDSNPALELFSFACFTVCCFCLFLFQGSVHAKGSEEEVSLTIREDGLCFSGAQKHIFYPWTSLRELREIPERKGNSWLAIIMNFAQNEVVPVPFSAFANDAERQTFVDAVNAGIGKAGH